MTAEAPDPSSEWRTLLDAPRHSNADLSRRSIPTARGVYAWFRDDACVYVGTAYVGTARNLRTRLSSHRATSLDLSRSTLRASVAVCELRDHPELRPLASVRDDG